MKNTSMATVLALTALLQSGLSQAGDLKCSNKVSVPEEALEGISHPVCLGLDEKTRTVIVSGKMGAGLTVKAFGVGSYESRRVSILSQIWMAELPKGSIARSAFAGTCGLSLMTSRILGNREALLIFDSFTVFRWNFSEGRLSQISSDFHEQSFHYCYGISEGVDTHQEYISLNRKKKILTIKAFDGEEVKQIRF